MCFRYKEPFQVQQSHKERDCHKIMVVEIRVWAIGCYVPNRNWCRSEMQKEGWDSAKRAYGDPLPIIT